MTTINILDIHLGASLLQTARVWFKLAFLTMSPSLIRYL